VTEKQVSSVIKLFSTLALLATVVANAVAASTPPAEAFVVLRQPPAQGPRITP
jgi:hypothetical protein